MRTYGPRNAFTSSIVIFKTRLRPAIVSAFIIVPLVLLFGCARDPNQRKQAYLRHGQSDIRSGKYKDAVIEFRSALEIDPRFAEAHYELGRAYLALKSPDAAYHELTNAVALEPSNAQAQLQLAKLLIARQQLDQAQSVAQTVLRAQPDNVEAHTILGEKHTLTRDFPKAAEEFQQIVKLEPQRVETYAALGAAYRAEGRMTEAENAYRKAVETSPKSVSAHVALSQFLFSMGKPNEAESEMRTACDLDPRAIRPRIFLARICLAMNRVADAERLYIALKAVAPNDPQAYQPLSAFYSATGQTEKAAVELRELAKAHPKDYAVKASLAETLLDLNQTSDAAPVVKEY